MWKGIVGKPFAAEDFREYVAGLKFNPWRPRFVVVHNTAAPTFADWHKHPGEVRMRNLEHYYRDEKQWDAGPHLFVADDFIWVFTSLTTSGRHSPSWNPFSWGVEVVGNYTTEPLSPAVLANAVSAIATLHEVIGLDPATMRAHREDPKTDHTDCPGPNLDVEKLRAAVSDELALRQVGEHVPGALTPEVLDNVVITATHKTKKAMKAKGAKPKHKAQRRKKKSARGKK